LPTGGARGRLCAVYPAAAPARSGSQSGALGHTGLAREGYRTAAFCFQDPGLVVVVLANSAEHDVETTAGNLVLAAST